MSWVRVPPEQLFFLFYGKRAAQVNYLYYFVYLCTVGLRVVCNTVCVSNLCCCQSLCTLPLPEGCLAAVRKQLVDGQVQRLGEDGEVLAARLL